MVASHPSTIFRPRVHIINPAMAKTTTLAERVAEATRLAEIAGYNAPAIAKACGISKQAVYKWLDGRTAKIEGSNLAVLSQLSGVEALWISTGRGPRLRKDSAILEARRVPIISPVQAGAWDEATDPFQPGDSDEVAFTTKEVGPNGYALRVVGDSMTSSSGRSFPEDCVIIIDPRRRDPLDRQFIVAQLRGHDAVTFKQFRRDDVGRIWLQPLNPLHQPIHEEFAVLGTVVQKVEDV